MSTLNIRQLKFGEEPPNNRQHLISNIRTLCSSHKERRLIIPNHIRIFVREVTHIVQIGRKVAERDAPDKVRFFFGADEVCKEELANC